MKMVGIKIMSSGRNVLKVVSHSVVIPQTLFNRLWKNPKSNKMDLNK